jgi:WhiB family transcriptional regulator, redox-sensing transcriptional regulator
MLATGAIHDTWQIKAACRGPESRVFFPPTWPERRDERDARESRAKAICNDCAVRVACLDYALQIREPHGIWGGLTENERRAVLDRRAG